MEFTNAQMTYVLFGIFAVILIIASTIGSILKFKAGYAPAPIIDNLNARINAWWVMLLVLGVAISLGKIAFVGMPRCRQHLELSGLSCNS